MRLNALGERAIPLREMVDAGIPVALGTDGVPFSMLWNTRPFASRVPASIMS